MQTTTHEPAVYIIGYGDIGKRVAGLLPDPSRITSVSRHPSHDKFCAEHVVADLDDEDGIPVLEVENAIIFYFAPPSAQGLSDSRMQRFLQAIAGQTPLRIVYISTTGVYGDSKGEWIDERADTRPSTDRGKRRLDAERQLSEFCREANSALVILRVPGIYGATRLPVERIRQGRPVVGELASFTNRIHEDDLARICIKAADTSSPPGIYNVSDGQPGNMTQYFKDIAAALDLPALPEITWQQAQSVMSPEMLSYLRESRRIDNRKLRQVLGIELLYPDFASGLKACVEKLKTGR